MLARIHLGNLGLPDWCALVVMVGLGLFFVGYFGALVVKWRLHVRERRLRE